MNRDVTDGDQIINACIGWPLHHDWYKGVLFHDTHLRNAVCLQTYAMMTGRLVFFNGDPSGFSPGVVKGVVIPPEAIHLRNMELRVRYQKKSYGNIWSQLEHNRSSLRAFAKGRNLPEWASFEAAVSALHGDLRFVRERSLKWRNVVVDMQARAAATLGMAGREADHDNP